MRKHLNRFCASPEGAGALINAWRESCLGEKVRDMNVACGEPAKQINLYFTIDHEAVVRCLNGCELHRLTGKCQSMGTVVSLQNHAVGRVSGG
jgi:hypothetical protein